MENYEVNIGAKVSKTAKKLGKSANPKPFKSGLLVNTVKGVITHPILGTPAYIFVEDESYVECKVCAVVKA